jgi:voltage-gated potassium channel Kch
MNGTNSPDVSPSWLKKLGRRILDIQWILFLISASIVFALGYWGFWLATRGLGYRPLDLLYFTLQLFVLQSGMSVPVNNWQLEFARFLAPLMTLYTLTFVIWILFENIRKIKLILTRGHVVICGLGYLGPMIAKYFMERNYPVVIIEKDPNNRWIEIFRGNGALVFTGDASREEILQKTHAGKASHVYALTGNDNVNAEIAVQCCRLAKATPGSSVVCHVHLESQDILKIFLESGIGALQWGGACSIEFFNLYQISGYCLQKTYPPFSTEEPDIVVPHILVIGLGRMGETLLVQTVRRWMEREKNGRKIVITAIDREAEQKRELLFWRYPSLPKYCDLNLVTMDVKSVAFFRGDCVRDLAEKVPFTKVYICIDDNSIGIASALALARNPLLRKVPIIIRTTYNEGIPRIFETLKENNPEFSNILTFPIVSEPCCLDIIVWGIRELFARIIHDNYRTMRLRQGATPLDDPAMRPWHELDEMYRNSNRDQADHIRKKIQEIGCGITVRSDWDEPLSTFTNQELEYLAEKEHERWMKEKIAQGWKPGPERNKERKETPFLIPYDQLSEEIKEYDREAVRQIPALLAKINLKIYRMKEGQVR